MATLSPIRSLLILPAFWGNPDFHFHRGNQETRLFLHTIGFLFARHIFKLNSLYQGRTRFTDGCYLFFVILKIFMLSSEYLKFVSLWWVPTELSPNVPVKYYINLVNTSHFFKHAINIRRFKKGSNIVRIFFFQYP